ncbi:MAG: hypothetical protein ACRDZU_01715 [Acidimicrobiales bacterium]
MRPTTRILTLVAAGMATVCLLVAPASAGKPTSNGGGGKPGGGGSTSTLSLVLLDSADGVPNYGEHATFEVSTTATARPFVQLDCYQGGTRVYGMSAGFFADYPFTTTYTLRGTAWTGGAADCDARLYYSSNNKTVVLKTLNFVVEA